MLSCSDISKGGAMKEMQDNRATIIFIACLSLAYLLPYHTYPIPTFFNDFLTVWGFVIAVVFVGGDKEVRIRLPWIAVLPLAIALLIGVQMAIGLVSTNSEGVFPIVYFLLAAVAIVIGASITARQGDSSRFCTYLAYAFVFVGLVSDVIGTFQFFAKESMFAPFMMLLEHKPHTAVRTVANIGQSNQLALLYCFSIASVWWLYQAARLRAAVAIGIVLVLLWGLVLTQSRIGWMIAPAFALLFYGWNKTATNKKVLAGLIAGFLVFYALMIALLPTISAAILDVAVASPGQRVGGGANSERLTLFQQALQISLNHPWFGTGWGSFITEQSKLDWNSGHSIYANNAHNLVLNFAAELGWPITIAVFGVLAYWFFTSCVRRDLSQESKFAILIFIAVLLHSMVEFPLWYALVLIPLALLMGMVHQERHASKEMTISRVYTVLFFFAMSAGLVFVANDYRRVTMAYQYLGMGSLGFDVKGGSADKQGFTIFPQYYDYFRFAQTEAVEDMPPETIAFMEKISERFGEVPNIKHMALIYTLNHRTDDAVSKLVKIRQFDQCGYSIAYGSWKMGAVKKPALFNPVIAKLPQPTAGACNINNAQRIR
jgi:O-antigen ligase